MADAGFQPCALAAAMRDVSREPFAASLPLADTRAEILASLRATSPVGEELAAGLSSTDAQAGAPASSTALDEALACIARLEGENARLESRFAALSASLETAIAIDAAALLPRLEALVGALVGAVIGAEARLSPDAIRERAAAALDLLPEAAGPVQLRLHPDDIVWFRGKLPDVEIAIDAQLPPGGLVIRRGHSEIRDSLQDRINRLCEGLGL